jgi:pentatricopeptide repeat protein
MEGWERDEVVYSVVMELYAEKGDVVGTRRLLKVMQEAYGRVGIKAWEALIRAYVASGHVRGAERVLKEMAWEGKVIGGERAWNMVLQGWMGEANAEEEVRRVWRMMQSRGIEGSHRSLRMLNEVLAKERGGMWNELS